MMDLRVLKEKGKKMYKSPIEITCDNYMKQYVEQFDNSVFMAIEKKFGANIDRAEPVKALNYDRGQYEKGFEDGKKAAQPTWISCAERLPDEQQEVICLTSDGSFRVFGWTYIDWMWFDDNEWWDEKDVTHWMPLPQPPKEMNDVRL